MALTQSGTESLSMGFGNTQGPTDLDTAGPVVLTAGDNGQITLPDGVDIGAADLAREGQNLVLTSEDGQVFIVENYFLAGDAPVIAGASGAVLTPELVQSFLKSGSEYASNTTVTDQSPVGEITEVSGNATVIRADGTKETVAAGTPIFKGDIVETDAKGAVNIRFIDESTFAISENARLAVDDFNFNADDQSGNTVLSILRGVFMFTSGLVGRENPDAVEINTPVGSIGIRGTIIGGRIDSDGESQISVLEGAIVVRNASGEQILSDQYETVKLTGFNSPISNIGVLDAGSISQSYGSVRAVSPTLFTTINDSSADNTQSNQPAENEEQSAEASASGNEGAQSEGSNNSQQAAQSQEAQTADTQATEAQATEATADASANSTQTQVAASEPVFQTLQTGSNIGPVNTAAASAPAATPAPQAAVQVTATPAAAQPAQTTTATTQAANNTAPVFDTRPPAPVQFASGGGLVLEEAAAGTVVGTLGMRTALPFAVTYSIVNNPGNAFAINASTGVVTLATAAFDRDADGAPAGYQNLVVRATRTDTGQFTDTSFNIPVLAANEHAPTFSDSNTPAFAFQGNHVILTHAMVGASDADSNTSLSYSVSNLQKGIVRVFDSSTDTWSTATSFTQADLATGKVMFVHTSMDPMGVGFTLTASDGTNATTSNVNVNIGHISINSGETFRQTNINNITADYTGIIQGNHAGNTIAEGSLLAIIEPKNFGANTLQISNLSIENFIATGSTTLAAHDLEIVARTNDFGQTNLYVKIKDGRIGKQDFTDGLTESISFTLKATMPGGAVIEKPMTFLAANNFMALESVNGTNGFLIQNNARFSTEGDNVKFGDSMAVGDIDGDGRVDLIFGAPRAQNGQGEVSGGLYGFLNNTNLVSDSANGHVRLSTLTTPAATQSVGFVKEPTTAGDDANRFYGKSVITVAGLGDNKNTAYIAVSNAASNTAGSVEILAHDTSAPFGQKLMAQINGLNLGATTVEERSEAIKLASIGDLNGDGHNDFLISTHLSDVGAVNAGQVHIVYGRSAYDTATSLHLGSAQSLSTHQQVSAGSPIAQGFFGSSITGLQDFNGDGYADFAVGAQGIGNGRVTVFLGSHTGMSSQTITIEGAATGSLLGKNIASAGDVNHDGRSDLIMKDHTGNDTLFVKLGETVSSSQNFSVSDIGGPRSGFRIYSSDNNIQIGDNFGSAGDFNGDGIDDIYMDITKTVGSEQQRSVAILYGNKITGDVDVASSAFYEYSNAFHIKILDSDVNNITVTKSGDIDRNGFDDLLISTRGGQSANGNAFVVYGSNYDGKAEIVTSTSSTFIDEHDKSYIGNSSGPFVSTNNKNNIHYSGLDGNDTLRVQSATGVSFDGGAGNDILKFENQTGVNGLSRFKGGTGQDEIELYFSSGEGSAANDTIDFRGLGSKISGVEGFFFWNDSNDQNDSKNDILQLDIRDVLSLALTSDNHKFYIKDFTGTANGNKLTIFDGNNAVSLTDTSLGTLGLQFSVGGTTSESGINYHVYTHNDTGAQLLVDARLSNATTLM